MKTPKMKYRIISRNIVPRDAVSNFVIDLNDILVKHGKVVQLYAQGIDSEYKDRVKKVSEIFKENILYDTIFCSYSIYDEFFNNYSKIPCKKKILYFHNVTHGNFFAPFSEDFATILNNSISQYPMFSQYDVLMANSAFSLETALPYANPDVETLIHPPFFSFAKFKHEAEPDAYFWTAKYPLLWVGRITPHKRPDLAMQIFDTLIQFGVDASLTFVGSGKNDFPRFSQFLDAVMNKLSSTALKRIRFLQNLNDAELAWLYRHSSLLLCTSAHEGYCMPLVEAAACGLPVAVTPQPAVLETLNGGGIILEEEPRAAAMRIRNFLLADNPQEHRAAVPILRPLPTDEFLRLIIGGN